jgi:DNA-binding CsgD family transcriptional regulator
LLEQAESLAAAREWPRLSAAIALNRVWLCCNEGRVREAAIAHEQLDRLAKKQDASVDYSWSEIHRYSGLARAYVASAQERFEEAIRTLERVKSDAERVHDHYFALRAANHLCFVRFRAGQAMEAVREFRHVLDTSAQAGIQQMIVDEGRKIGPLLTAFKDHAEKMKKWGDLKPYFDGLTAAWGRRYQTGADAGPRSALKDALSTREGAILNLIADGLSNKEIARNLAIAPETVKSHVKNLFVKLNAEKRAQAVAVPKASDLSARGEHHARLAFIEVSNDARDLPGWLSILSFAATSMSSWRAARGYTQCSFTGGPIRRDSVERSHDGGPHGAVQRALVDETQKPYISRAKRPSMKRPRPNRKPIKFPTLLQCPSDTSDPKSRYV